VLSVNVRTAKRLLDCACGVGRFRRLLIFTFHRVLPDPDPLLPGEPSAAEFGRRLDWMRSCLQVLSLPEAARMLREGTLPARAACITFDDGYRNNHDVAAPLLAERALHASFFVATGAIEKGAMWNDLVIEAVRRCGDRLDLEEFGLPSVDMPAEGSRVERLESVLQSIKYQPMERRAEIADRLWSHYCGGGKPPLMMSRDMLRSLARAGHDVGSHTVNHPILLNLPVDAARREIEASRDWITKVLGRPPRTFAYPNGRPGVDFGPEHARMVQDAGFECAASTTWGCARPASDPYALERFTPWEDDFAGFVTRVLKTYLRSYVSQG
jgi:peptidoglycan/xylan/chitin deacetylase (PgdA/CDA1 family)